MIRIEALHDELVRLMLHEGLIQKIEILLRRRVVRDVQSEVGIEEYD